MSYNSSFLTHWLDRPGLVFSEFPSRIRIGYVVRGEGNYSYLCDEEFSGLSATLQEVHAAALENLAKLPSAQISIGKVPGGAEGWIHVARRSRRRGASGKRTVGRASLVRPSLRDLSDKSLVSALPQQ